MEQAVLKLHDFPFLWPMGTVVKVMLKAIVSINDDTNTCWTTSSPKTARKPGWAP